MISHSAVISEVAGLHAFLKQISYGSTITQDDVVLSYLPLAHIFDRCALSEPRRAHSWSCYEKSRPLREGARLLLHQLPWKATSCHLLATCAWTKQRKSGRSRRWCPSLLRPEYLLRRLTRCESHPNEAMRPGFNGKASFLCCKV